jgi:hypothetical protein
MHMLTTIAYRSHAVLLATARRCACQQHAVWCSGATSCNRKQPRAATAALGGVALASFGTHSHHMLMVWMKEPALTQHTIGA